MPSIFRSEWRKSANGFLFLEGRSRVSREGLATIAIIFFVALALGTAAYHFRHPVWWFLFAFNVVFLLMIIYFYRDPRRVPPADPNVIVSPADGRVLDVIQVEEGEFIKDRVTRVDIFLSVFDVHVNYVPFRGRVSFYRYQPGKFLRAHEPAASSANEHTLIGVESEHGRFLFKQSVGILARRVICHLRVGDQVTTGQKFGLMKFGSRMEVYLPAWADIQIKKGDRVRGGESVIARIHEN